MFRRMRSVSLKALSFLALAVVLGGCFGEEENSCPALQQINCTLTETMVYPIGTNVLADFNVNSITMTDTVITSNCAGVSPGEMMLVSVPNATRTGNSILIDQGEDGTLPLTVSGTSLSSPMTLGGCVGGISISQTVSGNLNSSTNKIELNLSTSMITTNCCDTSLFPTSGPQAKAQYLNTAFLELK